MDEVNATEDAEHGAEDDGSGGLPAEPQSRERRLAKLRAVRAEIKRGTTVARGRIASRSLRSRPET